MKTKRLMVQVLKYSVELGKCAVEGDTPPDLEGKRNGAAVDG